MNSSDQTLVEEIKARHASGGYDGDKDGMSSLDIAVLLSIIERLTMPAFETPEIRVSNDYMYQVIKPVEDIAIDFLSQMFATPPSRHDLLAGDI